MAVLASCSSSAQQAASGVRVVGAMRNVMWKGQLQGTLYLDTIPDKAHLYGMGPVEYLSGELLIWDGRSYKSSVLSDTAMRVEETYDARAPFFAYASVPEWTEQALPDSIETIQQLERYLDETTQQRPRPFLFKLSGSVRQATIHIVNLPNGSQVRSPEDAHQGQRKYELENASSEILGFFSIGHKAIFTHHDTFLHLHLLTADRTKMGHLEQAQFAKGSMRLYLPAE